MSLKIKQKIINFIKNKLHKKVHYPKASIDTIIDVCYVLDTLIGHGNIKNIFEFGARYGEDTIEFAKRYPNTQIYSYECNPNTIKKCKKNVSKYKNINLTNKAISDCISELEFFSIDKKQTKTTHVDGNQGASSLFKASGKYPIENYVQNSVKVQSTTLEHELILNNIDVIDFMWMDVQGAELKALIGLGNKIENVKIILAETEYFEIYKDQPLFNELCEFLDNKGYKFIGNLTESEYSADALFINTKFFNIDEVLKLDKSKIKRLNKGLQKFLYIKDFDFYKYPKYNCSSNEKIDVMIPTCTKDLKTLEKTIEGIRKNVKHPIENIYIISPQENIKNFDNLQNCILVDENTVLPINVSDINYYPQGIDRRGWIFQQLLKLNVDNICKNDNILIVDSDTIFSRPQIFIEDNKTILNCSDEYHIPYSKPNKKLLNMNKRFDVSFVSHHMLINKIFLKEIKQRIENECNEIWYQAILNSLDNNEISSFSEYELYGNYMYYFHNDKIKLRYWYNLSTNNKGNSTVDGKTKNLYKTISYHSYNQ